MKKYLLALVLLFVLFGCVSSPKTYNDGTYTGTGVGKKGDVVVSVTLRAIRLQP